MRIKCKYSKCEIYFDKYRNKKCCSYAHNTLHWVEKHHERRLEINMKYERKMGVIPREEYMKNQWKKENNPNWRGGNVFRTNKEEWRTLARKVRERDNYTCQICGILARKNLKMPVHHIIPWNIIPEDKEENLITLCNSCHARIEWKIRKGADFLSVLA